MSPAERILKMSVHIVEENTIDQIIEGMDSIKDFQEYTLDCLGINLQTQKAKDEFGQLLLELNYQAYRDKYGYEGSDNEQADTKEIESYKNHPAEYKEGVIKALQSIQSLKCWLYQCSEESTVSDPLYKTMETVVAEMALEYVRALPEFKLTEWD